ncbi:MAG: hypothetical protein HY811_11180 [Planctomycetes bacterium]|nr:hypothetical protein [Planctomycetota bacterium]
MENNKKSVNLLLRLTPHDVNAFADVLVEGILRMRRKDVSHPILFEYNNCYNVEVKIMNTWINPYIKNAVKAGAYGRKTLNHMGIEPDDNLVAILRKGINKRITPLILRLSLHEVTICNILILEGLLGFNEGKRKKYYYAKHATNIQKSIKVGKIVAAKMNLYLKRTQKTWRHRGHGDIGDTSHRL